MEKCKAILEAQAYDTRRDDMLEQIRNHKSGLLDEKEYRKYAVFIPLLENGGSYDVLFEVRSRTVGRQPGDICFPGGRIEGGETAQEAAVRETVEELQVAPGQLEVLSLLDIYVNNAGNIIYPFAGLLSGYEGTCSEDEVEETFRVPLDFFLETEPQVYYTNQQVVPEEGFPYDYIQGGKNYPWNRRRQKVNFYFYQDGEKLRVIWGMTAKMMRMFVEIWSEKPGGL